VTRRPDKLPGRNDPCWCGSGKKYKKCHLREDRERSRNRRRAALRPAPEAGPVPDEQRILLKSPAQIEGIRRASRLTREILEGLTERVREGVTTGEIDAWVQSVMTERGARSATLGYRGFPKSCCISINEVICHGIPGERAFADGDVVNVDVTSVLDGYYGDASNMYLVGNVSEEARRLVEVTRECLERGIAVVRPGARVGDVGHAIQTHAETHGYSVVRDFVGHGVGVRFHEPPQVPHFGEPGTGPELRAGMVFTIEPMINAGGYEAEVLADGWTAVTRDRSLSAQWEHTLAVTEDGVDVLTR
jgi:methionyl aminopeptidase